MQITKLLKHDEEELSTQSMDEIRLTTARPHQKKNSISIVGSPLSASIASRSKPNTSQEEECAREPGLGDRECWGSGVLGGFGVEECQTRVTTSGMAIRKGNPSEQRV